MAEDYQNTEKTKATVQIETELYNRVSNKLHYGQLSSLLRNMFESIDQMIKEDNLMEVVHYIYKEQPLLLTPIGGEYNNVINGQDKN